jgi:hypothetical protein
MQPPIGRELRSREGGQRPYLRFPDCRLVEAAGAISLAFGVNETCKEINVKIHDTATGFFILCGSGCEISVCTRVIEKQYMPKLKTRAIEQ